jgi:RNA polymerase sigma-54 factor
MLPGEAPQYIVPDVLVRRREGRWLVELNAEALPHLRVNERYAALVGRGAQAGGLREQLAEARWLVKSLEMRNETLLKVATAIVQRQREFLERGDEAMKPMILRDIATAVGMHESTISRVTTQKYMHTPRGIFEFKYFFSSHVGTADGGEESATAIRAMIRRLIDGEDGERPLSDSAIATVLGDRGIDIARRTVTKYREAMAIPASHERRQHAIR